MGKYPNSGVLSRNDNRKTDKSPEYSGTAEVGGIEYWLGAWVNEKDGRKFFRISFTPKENQPHYTSEGSQEPSDDIPF
jgi:hypothetical protein